MKAFYKQHQGFQHLTQLTPHPTTQAIPPNSNPPIFHTKNTSYQISSLNNNNNSYDDWNNVMTSYANRDNRNKYDVDDTSTKKYPNNKYFQFNGEESSGRKYLKEKLNLYEDQEQQQEHIDYQQETRNKRNGQISCREINYQQPQYQPLSKTTKQVAKAQNKNPSTTINVNKQTTSKTKSKTNKSSKQNSVSTYITHFYEEKQNTNPNVSQIESNSQYKLDGKKMRDRRKKISASISTIQSKQQYPNKKCANKSITSKTPHASHNHQYPQSPTSQLTHYKQLCLDLRKKNASLSNQLQHQKQTNLTSLQQLQRKIQKLSNQQKQKKQIQDQCKAEKIMESLKVIKNKLNKSEKEGKGKEDKERREEERRFYQFFVESLGIFGGDGQSGKGDGKKSKYNALEVQIIWKHMLQFLITKDYKIDEVIGNRYIK